MTETQAIATKVADKISNDGSGPLKVVDIALILSVVEVLLPAIIKCFNPEDGESAQKHVVAKYSDDKGYSRAMLIPLTGRARRAARRKGSRIDRAQAQQMAIATLDTIRESDSEKLNLAVAEHSVN